MKTPKCKPAMHEWDYTADVCILCGRTFADLMIDSNNKTVPVCQCGAEAAGFSSHTHWCPKKETEPT